MSSEELQLKSEWTLWFDRQPMQRGLSHKEYAEELAKLRIVVVPVSFVSITFFGGLFSFV